MRRRCDYWTTRELFAMCQYNSSGCCSNTMGSDAPPQGQLPYTLLHMMSPGENCSVAKWIKFSQCFKRMLQKIVTS